MFENELQGVLMSKIKWSQVFKKMSLVAIHVSNVAIALCTFVLVCNLSARKYVKSTALELLTTGMLKRLGFGL